MTWKPISTAPEDSSSVLLWDARVGLVQGWKDRRGRWVETWTGEDIPNPEELTHWMEPPAPPATSDTAAFLARMHAAAETGERVTAEDVGRLRKMADWADAPPPAGWNGTLDRHEAMRAIAAAERRMRDE